MKFPYEKVLIDSDVILDIFLRREPFFKKSAEILSICHERKIKGFITPLIVANVYYILKKSAGSEKAILEIAKLSNVLDTFPMDGDTIQGAIRSGFGDFEDALQNQAAENSGADTIITRNLKDYRKSKLAVMEPESFLKIFLNR